MQPRTTPAGYHGYWITDFTQIDPHLGTNEDLARLVDAAHARGMKVFFDIITNHTADVIDYRDHKRPAYGSKDEFPYKDAAGREFDDRDYAGTSRFPPLDRERRSRTRRSCRPASRPRCPRGSTTSTLYHNRGNTTFVGENSQYGDFFGLDDLFTEHPRVVRGMEDIYKAWIRDFGIDGFRIDTMKHVDDEFWKAFAPDVLRYAHRQGKREFFMFGEVFDTSRPFTSHFTTDGPRAGRARLPVPGRGAGTSPRAPGRPTRCATSSPATTGTRTPTRTRTSCRRSSATTTWAGSACSCRQAQQRGRATPRCSPATGSRTS